MTIPPNPDAGGEARPSLGAGPFTNARKSMDAHQFINARQFIDAHQFIDARQLLAVLLLSRLFVLLIFVPEKNPRLNGAATLVSLLLGYGLTGVAMLPMAGLFRRLSGMDAVDATQLLLPRLHRPVAAVYGLLFALVAAETATQFEFFMTSAIYPHAGQLGIVLIFLAAACYMAWLGLEAVSRSALVIALFTLVSWALVLLGVREDIDLLNLYSPLYYGVQPILQSTLGFFAQNVELIALACLTPRLTTTRVGRVAGIYLGISLAMLEGIIFTVATVLGSYGDTRTFPIYAVFTISGSNVFNRMDYVHVAIWVAISLVRGAVFLLLAAGMFARVMPRRMSRSGWAPGGAAALLAGGLACWASTRLDVFLLLYRLLSNPLPVLLLAVLWPGVLLWLCRRRERRGDPVVLSLLHRSQRLREEECRGKSSQEGEALQERGGEHPC